MRPPANDNLVMPRKRRLFSKPRGAALFAVACAPALLAALILPPAWRATGLREAYLPQLEASARSHPEDGPLAALLAARLMQAGEAGAAAAALKQAAGAGEQTEAVWLALAASNAAAGQSRRALADLRLGVKSLPDSTLLPSRMTDARAMGPSPAPGALAAAISPQGPDALLAVYGRGSFLNGLAEWWGRRHTAGSGFATREAWAEAQPGNAQAQRLWGEALTRNRRLPEALAALRAASGLAPQSLACHLALADALRRGTPPGSGPAVYRRPDPAPELAARADGAGGRLPVQRTPRLRHQLLPAGDLGGAPLRGRLGRPGDRGTAK